MALIKCPECGKMFSEHATKCPQCGLSITNVARIVKEKEEKERREEEEKQRLDKEKAEQEKKERHEWWQRNISKIILSVVAILLITVLSLVGRIIYRQLNKPKLVEPSQTIWKIGTDSSEPLSGSVHLGSEYIVLDLRGNIGASDGLLKYDESTDSGYYTYYLRNGAVTRTIKMYSYEGDDLILESYDKKGDYVGKFYGKISINNGQTIYSGTFTNYKGASVKFNLKQDE